ncbi:MAG: hypothetical protein ACRC4L_03705, partial [Mycoplasma sp.]
MIKNKLIYNDEHNILKEFEEIHKNEGIVELNCYVGYSNFFTIMKVLSIFENTNKKVEINIYYSVNVSTKYIINSNFIYNSLITGQIIPKACLEILDSFITYFNKIKINPNIKLSLFKLESEMTIEGQKKIFHGKVYEIITKNNKYLIIGSANLTNNGISPIQSTRKNDCHHNYLNEFSVMLSNVSDNSFIQWKKELDRSYEKIKINNFIDFKPLHNIKDLLHSIYKDINDDENTSNTLAIEEFRKNSEVYAFLKDEQKQTAEKIIRSMTYFGGGVLNYDVGLGKTLVALAVFDFFKNYLKKTNITVLVPTKLKEDWLS